VAVDAHGNALTWRGKHWSAPQHIDGRNALVAISCPAAGFCVTVDGVHGRTAEGEPSGARAVVFTDGRWQAPVAIDSGHRLTDVSCATRSRCIAVDNAGRAIMRTSGGWQAPISAMRSAVTALSCPTARFCLAVGDGVSRFDGHRWHRVAAPNRWMFDVSCVGPRDCTLATDRGYLQWHEQTWSTPIVGSSYLDPETNVECASLVLCLGSETDGAGDAFEYQWDGAATHYRSHWMLGAPLSCTAQPFCAGVFVDTAWVGHGS
jgi:hypothetical protein